MCWRFHAVRCMARSSRTGRLVWCGSPELTLKLDSLELGGVSYPLYAYQSRCGVRARRSRPRTMSRPVRTMVHSPGALWRDGRTLCPPAKPWPRIGWPGLLLGWRVRGGVCGTAYAGGFAPSRVADGFLPGIPDQRSTGESKGSGAARVIWFDLPNEPFFSLFLYISQIYNDA